jgi:hypothetical protein
VTDLATKIRQRAEDWVENILAADHRLHHYTTPSWIPGDDHE